SPICCFFFSSRRRHTSFSRDWSSDVCSSDLSRHVTGDKKTNKCQKNNRRPLKPAGGIAVPAWRNIRPGQHGHRGQTRCGFGQNRSEEHTSELQSRENLVCRLLLEKKNEIVKV